MQVWFCSTDATGERERGLQARNKNKQPASGCAKRTEGRGGELGKVLLVHLGPMRVRKRSVLPFGMRNAKRSGRYLCVRAGW